MSITVSMGRSPATASIRQNCLDGSYTYLETIYNEDQIAGLILELSQQLVRIRQYQRRMRKERAAESV